MGKHSSIIEKAKLVMLFALPFLIFLCIALWQIFHHETDVRAISNIEKQVQLSTHISSLVHELQKERGDSGIYLSSQGALFSDELLIQRHKTDNSYTRLNRFLTTFNYLEYPSQFIYLLEHSQLSLQSLDEIRNKISLSQMTAVEAIEYFTNVNRHFLNVIEEVAQNSPEPDLVFAIISYTNFLRGKELLGIERALLSHTFTQDYFEEGAYRQFMKLVTEQNVYHQRFLSLTKPELVNEFNGLNSDEQSRKVQKYRNIAHKNAENGHFGVNVKSWFNAISAKIDQFKILEDAITNDLTQTALQKKTESEVSLVRWRVFIFVLSLSTAIVGFWMVRRISLTFERRLEEYGMLFENSSAGMVVVHPINKKILFCNAAFASKLGYSKEALSCMSLSDLHPKTSIVDKGRCCDFTAPDSLKENGTTFIRQNGDVLLAEVTVFPMNIEGIMYMVASIKDITERQKVMNENLLLLGENKSLIQRNYVLQEAERRDIARELHDQLGQELVGIMLQADSLCQLSSKQDHQGVSLTASNIAKNIRSIISSTRDLTNKLRPVSLDQLGLESALCELIDAWSKLNKDTNFKFTLHNSLPDVHGQISICVYRIVQENLTNIGKHAKANDVSISLRYDECLTELNTPALTLLIIDNGIGMSTNKEGSGMGVISMRERIQGLGGLFYLTSEPNDGVKIIAHIPVVVPLLVKDGVAG